MNYQKVDIQLNVAKFNGLFGKGTMKKGDSVKADDLHDLSGEAVAPVMNYLISLWKICRYL